MFQTGMINTLRFATLLVTILGLLVDFSKFIGNGKFLTAFICPILEHSAPARSGLARPISKFAKSLQFFGLVCSLWHCTGSVSYKGFVDNDHVIVSFHQIRLDNYTNTPRRKDSLH